MQAEDLIVKAIETLSESWQEMMRRFREEADVSDLFNVTFTQLHYLHAINELTAPTFGDLAERYGVQKSTVTAIISKLVQRNYVYKVQSQNDLRVFHISLTAKGKRLIEYENRAYRHFTQLMLKNLNADEKAQIAVLLNKFVGSMASE